MRVAWAVVTACCLVGVDAWGLSGWHAVVTGPGTVIAARDSGVEAVGGPSETRTSRPPVGVGTIGAETTTPLASLGGPLTPTAGVSASPPTHAPLTNSPQPTLSTTTRNPLPTTTHAPRPPTSTYPTTTTPTNSTNSMSPSPQPSQSDLDEPQGLTLGPTTSTGTPMATPSTTTRKPEVLTPPTTTKKPEVSTSTTATREPQVPSASTITDKPEAPTPSTTSIQNATAPVSNTSTALTLIPLATVPPSPRPIDTHGDGNDDATFTPRTTPPASTQPTRTPPFSNSSTSASSAPTRLPVGSHSIPVPTSKSPSPTATPPVTETSPSSAPNATTKPPVLTTPKPSTTTIPPNTSTTLPIPTPTTGVPSPSTTRPSSPLGSTNTTKPGATPPPSHAPSLLPSPTPTLGHALPNSTVSALPIVSQSPSTTTAKPSASSPPTTVGPSTEQPLFTDPAHHSNRSPRATPTPSVTASLLALQIISDLEHPNTAVGQDLPPQRTQSVATSAPTPPEATPSKLDEARLVDTPSGLVIKNGSSTEQAHEYKRLAPSSTSEPDFMGSASGFDGGSVVLGGRNRTRVIPGADVGVSSLGQTIQATMRVTSSGITVMTVVLLVVFHVLALHSPLWLPSGRRRVDRLTQTWLTPQVWELPVIFTFFQHIGSISMMELTKAPYFVLDFTDSFSWTNFNLRAMGSGVSRHLEYTILTGMVAYADRLGVEESKLLTYTSRIVFAAVGVILGVFFAVVFLRRYSARYSAQSNRSKYGFALCFLGLTTALWVVSAFPLCATSSFELRMELQFSLTGDLAIVLFNILVVLLGGLALFVRRVQNIRPEDALDYRYVAVFGTLYADSKSGTRFFFALFILFHMGTGAIIGTMIGGQRQVIALLVLHAVFIVALIVVRPFRHAEVNTMVGALTVFRFANLMLSTVFVTASTMSTEDRAKYANTLVFANFVVILLIFFRQFLVLVYVLRMWLSRHVQTRIVSPAAQTSYTIELDANLHTGDDNTVVQVISPRTADRAAWNPGASFAGSESPVPNLANRPEKSPFPYEFVITKK